MGFNRNNCIIWVSYGVNIIKRIESYLALNSKLASLELLERYNMKTITIEIDWIWLSSMFWIALIWEQRINHICIKITYSESSDSVL